MLISFYLFEISPNSTFFEIFTALCEGGREGRHNHQRKKKCMSQKPLKNKITKPRNHLIVIKMAILQSTLKYMSLSQNN